MYKAVLRGISAFLLLVTLSLVAHDARASSEESADSVNISDMIMHHVVDSHSWHFFDGPYGTLYLPVVVYTPEQGLSIFSSARFEGPDHQPVDYQGYRLEHEHIYDVVTGRQAIDLSITKNVAMLFLTAAALVLIFFSVARGGVTNRGKAPKGIQSLLEPLVRYLAEDVIKPSIGPHYRRYTPYLLTLFFFILLGNLLGLLPGAANLTGNISVTVTLALFTFLITNLRGNKHYWGHIFWTPGVPFPLRPIIAMVEFIGLFTKPFALTIRLFAAITAGHIVILSLLSMVFIFRSYWTGVGVSVFLAFINLVELLVALIQAYVFTLFSALYIGNATAEH